MPRTGTFASGVMREQAASDAFVLTRMLARAAAIVAMPFAGRLISRGSRNRRGVECLVAVQKQRLIG